MVSLKIYHQFLEPLKYSIEVAPMSLVHTFLLSFLVGWPWEGHYTVFCEGTEKRKGSWFKKTVWVQSKHAVETFRAQLGIPARAVGSHS